MKIILFSTILQTLLASDSNKLYRVKNLTPEKARILGENFENLDFWTQNKNFVDIYLDETADHISFQNQLSDSNSLNLEFDLLMDDVEKVVEEQAKHRLGYVMERENLADFNYTVYHEFEEIEEWIDMVQKEHDFVTVENVGTSYEGRPIRALKIAPNEAETDQTFFFNVNIHAREWIASASMMKVVSNLVTGYAEGRTDEVRILSEMDIYVVMMSNPDGFAYSHEVDRMWRKTRTYFEDPENNPRECYGTDPNRNFGTDLWADDVGSSGNPCSSVYRGPEPFSEPNCEAVKNYLIQVQTRKQVKAFIDVHSYSQLWIYTWAEKTEDIPNKGAQDLIGRLATA